jgi:hypothetical protein
MEQEQQKTTQQMPEPNSLVVNSPQPPLNKSRKKLVILIVLLLAVIGAVIGYLTLIRNPAVKPTNSSSAAETQVASELPVAEGLQLDTSKDYGDKYADGVLPVGDEHFVTDTAKKGYVYICNDNFVPDSQAGAQVRGPWFTNNNTEWDINKKSAVQGEVSWQNELSIKVEDSKRIITTNDLPDHHTGVFPVRRTDAAYKYDRNPNTISAQSLVYNLAASPQYGTPKCMSGEVGVMLTGAALFNGFDAGGRDAGAWEVQDSCDGHPQNKGEYHYHTLSRCVADIGVNTIIGYALDGYPITGPKVGDNNYLTTDDLDECHGIVSELTVDTKKTKTYHYVMTQDFPYSVSCFRAEAIKAPGLPEGRP